MRELYHNNTLGRFYLKYTIDLTGENNAGIIQTIISIPLIPYQQNEEAEQDEL